MASQNRNFVLVCFCIILLVGPSYSETDTLAQGQKLKDGMQLFSAYGIFRLGFFHLDPANNNSYLGIAYNRDNEKPVWVANRDNPILGNSGILTIDQYGNLKIISHNMGESDSIVLNSVQAAINATAILLDSGNFLLRELNPDGSVKRDLWQSFDYPTDTLLPKMKLGFDIKTGLNRTLTSWRTDNIPASGSFFTLGMDPSGINQMVIWWHRSIHWTSGAWHNGCFNMFDEFCHKYKYNFSYISNGKETCFNYSVNKEITIFPRLTVSAGGELKGFGMDFLFTVFSCTTDSAPSLRVGCVEQKFPECRSSRNKFESKRGVMSGDRFKFDENDNLTIIDCWDKCFKNCSCMAYASANKNGTGCEIWTKGSSFTEYKSASFREMYILDIGVPKWWIWVLILVGVTVISPFLFSSCYVLWKKSNANCNRIQSVEENMLLHELGQVRKNEKDGKMSNELHMFSFESLLYATGNFSTANKLGQGGFGPVYKGKLLDGQEVAIKRLSRSSGQGLVEFKNEALLIAKLQHTNLVRLLGFCIQREEKMLIYEYMPNKSLDSSLFNAHANSVLSWRKRYSIIEGIAQGLVYLHKYSRLRVIHRDLKPSNILLDEGMNPKISDFGMARIFGVNDSEDNTQRVVGTYGYMPPEYAIRGTVSIKTDVFSFGVILLEIVSGKKNNSLYHSEDPLNLIGYAWKLWNEDRCFELADPKMGEPCPVNEVLKCVHVGLLCVQDQATERPTMPEVVSMLSNDASLLPAPKPPAFFLNETVRGQLQVSENKPNHTCSTNRVTMSVLEAR